jgi:TatD DNase family protein
MLSNGTAPDDWQKVLALAAADKRVLPCFGLHPWFINKAGPLWLEELELFLKRAPSCVGEIGLDGAKNAGTARQEEVFTAQLKLAGKLSRPACLHCVKAWGRMLKIIKEELPGTFMLHSYGGPAEMIKEFSALGAYFSFGAAIMDPKRRKLRKALLTVPPERLLFETEPPGPDAPGLSSGPQSLPVLISAAAVVMGRPAKELAELSWANGIGFLGDIAG